MAMEVDGSAILTTIARAPSAFGMNSFQINTLAVNTIITKLKDKTTSLESVRAIANAIGKHDFEITIDQMQPKDAAAITKRLDPKHPNLKEGGEQWQRKQLVSLAAGEVEPTVIQAKTPRIPKVTPPKAESPKTGVVMKSKALRPRSARKPVIKDGR